VTASRSPIVACSGAAGAAWPVSMCAAATHAAATAAARISYAATLLLLILAPPLWLEGLWILPRLLRSVHDVRADQDSCPCICTVQG